MKSVGGTIVQPGASPITEPSRLPGWRRDLQRRTTSGGRNVNAYRQLSPINPSNSGFTFKNTVFRRVLGLGAAVFWPDTLGDGTIDLSNPKFQAMYDGPAAMQAAGFVAVERGSQTIWMPEFASPGVSRHYSQGLTAPSADIAPIGVQQNRIAYTLDSDTWSAIADMWKGVSEKYDEISQKLQARHEQIARNMADLARTQAAATGRPEVIANAASNAISVLVSTANKLDLYRSNADIGYLNQLNLERLQIGYPALVDNITRLVDSLVITRPIVGQQVLNDLERAFYRQQVERYWKDVEAEAEKMRRQAERLQRETERKIERLEKERRQLEREERRLEKERQRISEIERIRYERELARARRRLNEILLRERQAREEQRRQAEETRRQLEQKRIDAEERAKDLEYRLERQRLNESMRADELKHRLESQRWYENFREQQQFIRDNMRSPEKPEQPEQPLELPHPVQPDGTPLPEYAPDVTSPPVGRIDIHVTPSGVQVRGRPVRYRRTRRNTPRKSDNKVSGVYRSALRIINQTYGRYDEFMEYADAFFWNLEPTGEPQSGLWRQVNTSDGPRLVPVSYRAAYMLLIRGEAELDIEGFLRDIIVNQIEDRLFGLKSDELNTAHNRPVGLGFGPAL